MAINEKTGLGAIAAIAASVAGIFGIGIRAQNVSNFDNERICHKYFRGVVMKTRGYDAKVLALSRGHHLH